MADLSPTERVDLELRKALLAAQAELTDPPKSSTNSHFRSKYVNLHDLLATIRPVLTKHELILTQHVTRRDDQSFVTTRITHLAGGYVETAVPLVVDRQGPQAMGSALTYAKRQGLAMLMPTAGPDEDDDGEAAEGRATSRPPVARKVTRQINPTPFNNIEEAEAAIGLCTSTDGLDFWARRVKAAGFMGSDRERAIELLNNHKQRLAAKT